MAENPKTKLAVGKTPNRAGATPLFDLLPPKKVLGSLPPADTGNRAGCFFYSGRQNHVSSTWQVDFFGDEVMARTVVPGARIIHSSPRIVTDELWTAVQLRIETVKQLYGEIGRQQLI